jgi:hypothetical protein
VHSSPQVTLYQRNLQSIHKVTHDRMMHSHDQNEDGEDYVLVTGSGKLRPSVMGARLITANKTPRTLSCWAKNLKQWKVSRNGCHQPSSTLTRASIRSTSILMSKAQDNGSRLRANTKDGSTLMRLVISGSEAFREVENQLSLPA